MTCGPLKVGETCYLHLQGRIISQVRNHHEADKKQSLNEVFCVSSETLVDFQEVRWCYIAEDRTVQ
jgi:hypothetical protein